MDVRPSRLWLVGIAIAVLCACTPSHTIRPYPEFVKAGVSAGDRVEIVTKEGESLDVTVAEVAQDALISSHGREIPFRDIQSIRKRSWEKPALACGAGLPLGCSIPEVVKLIEPVDETVPKFESACVQHDFCYRHGHQTYGRTREQCDDEFLENLKAQCDEPVWQTVISLAADKAKCLAVAGQMYQAVRRYGQDKFRIANSTYCEYDGPPGTP